MTCENYTYLQGQAAESLEECSLDIKQSVPLKSSLTANKSSKPDNKTESCPTSQFSETSNHSMADHGEEKLTSLPEDSLAKTSVLPTPMEMELKGPGQDSGKKWPESFAKLNRDLHSWRTHQRSFFEDWEPFSQTWPKWGCMLDGECWELETSELGIGGPGSGCWLPTVVASEYIGACRARFVGSPEFRGSKMSEGLRICREDPLYLHPNFAEHTMGWPIMWTGLEPLETGKFQQWRQQHSKFFQRD